ncbi:MAG: thioredoxin 1 [Candidatus Tokpelaia sp. JSC161]|jgi:thioredoxin 1|nr:MAG: thioredoxin 1 [Candidatus Tokpelaia sp. JSC161]
MTILTIHADSFKEKVLQAKKPVLIDFWAEWCSPCKIISPLLDDIAIDMKDQIIIAKVNVDENPKLASQFGIRSIPTLLIFKNGIVLANMTGAVPKNRLVHWITTSLHPI